MTLFSRSELEFTFFTDKIRTGNILKVLEKNKNINNIIIRDLKDIEELKKIIKLCKQSKIRTLIKNDLYEMQKYKLAGVHFAEEKASLLRKRKYLKRYIYSTSCHEISSKLLKLHRNKFDLIFLSPIFSTNSHPEKKALGLLRAQYFIRKNKLTKICFLGGMEEKKLKLVQNSDFKNIGGISYFLNTL